MKKGIEIFSLQGKTVLITGATGHLGSAMAVCMAEAGAKVLVNSRSEKRCEQLVTDLKSTGLVAEPAVFDVTSKEEMQRFFTGFGLDPIHVVVNNAYVGGAGTISLTSDESYQESFNVTILAAHNLIRMALPNLRNAVSDAGDASVINISSMYGMVSPDQRIYSSPNGVNPPFYGAAKAALLQWTRYAACEFGKEGIRVNAISPGPFPSEQVQVSSSRFVETLCSKVPMGRIGQKNDIKGPALFLASSASSYVNGANIVADGGWTCW